MQRAVPLTLAEVARTARRIPEERRFAYLRQVCAGNDTLYRQAIAMFQPEISHPEWWADTTTTTAGNRTGTSDPTLGMTIGRYIVTGKLGSGGMSDVLLATPNDGQGPNVAIKLIRRATASPQLHSRLKVERQILGTLDHPNIARLLDGGNTHGGIPYLVMEYLQGEPIDCYCDQHCLTVYERLQLFHSVCLAVHAAHERSIIHRDLKPSNILVTPAGVPKLLDFGIAKILDEREREQTQVVTHADVRMLTPDYASPEQIRGDPLSTSSDIYALGVLLYELLTGRNPRVATQAERKTLTDVMAREDFPPPLAYWLGECTDGPQPPWLMQLCDKRSTTPAKLHREFSGELNTIVLSAMRREPERRYASAELLAAKIEEYLTGRPVAIAQPQQVAAVGSASNPMKYFAGAVIAIVLLAAIGWIAWSRF